MKGASHGNFRPSSVVYSWVMSTYQALYRKWRPRHFGELVGQEPVARTLSNAISSGKLAHAYLFTGPRGTGKTSSARIFAKSLNCEQGPTVTPCETCAACLGIGRGNFPDVIEIDAASHRGVDDARDLRERVRFAPSAGRYKVFIIDEVHMLTNEAFNALLKTIEEPPPNLVFILATTDVHKVLPTIISRCQRFDFQRIPFRVLVDHLSRVAEAEGFSVEPAGIEAIAKRADGGLRDALSLLDQVRSCASSLAVSAQEVFDALGLVSVEAVGEIVGAIARGEVTPAIEGLHSLLAAGFDHHGIVRELLEFFRHVMLVGLAPDRAEALDIQEGQRPLFLSLASQLNSAEVLYALEVLRETEQQLRGSNQMTIWLELMAIRLSQRDEIPSVLELSRRVAALEERLAQPGVAARAAAAKPASSPPPATAPHASQSAAPAAATPAPQPAASAVAPAATTPTVAPAAPMPTSAGDQSEVLPGLLAALAKVHRSTYSLIEQHALRASRDGQTLTIVIRPTMRTFFEKADRKGFIDKAAVAAFGPGTRVSLTFEAGDPARPNPAGATGVTPAEPPAPRPVEPPAPSPVAPPPAPSAMVALPSSDHEEVPEEPPKVSPPAIPHYAYGVDALRREQGGKVPVDGNPVGSRHPQALEPVVTPVAERPEPNRGDRTDVLAEAARIFNGRVIDPVV